MEIRWLGHACFTVTHRGYTLCIDPYNADYIPWLSEAPGREGRQAPHQPRELRA